MTKGLEDEGLDVLGAVGQLVIFLIVAGVAGVLAAILPARRATSAQRAGGTALRVACAPVKRVALLGATGSIGRQALDVVEGHDDLAVVALAAGRSDEELVAGAERLGVRRIALADRAAAARARAGFAGEVLEGAGGLARLAGECGGDVVLNAVVGAAGLDATLAALEAGIDVALANKESLVAGGPLVAERGAGRGPPAGRLRALGALPAPARRASRGAVDAARAHGLGRAVPRAHRNELAGVTRRARRSRHPTWEMGAKITIDSATLMNKGLEVIEAH